MTAFNEAVFLVELEAANLALIAEVEATEQAFQVKRVTAGRILRADQLVNLDVQGTSEGVNSREPRLFS